MSDRTISREILPWNRTPLEGDFTETIFTTLDLRNSYTFADIWDPDRCPREMLDWLAWHRKVDGYDQNWSERKKRNVIKESPEIHLKKGTLQSIEMAIEAAGFGRATIEERSSEWAKYIITLSQPINRDQERNILNILKEVAGARNELERFDSTVLIKWDGQVKWNGQYRWGG